MTIFFQSYKQSLFKILQVMSWRDSVEYTLASVIIVINLVALVVMNRSKDSIKNKNQRNIIIALCLCELSGAVFSICFYMLKYHISMIVLVIIVCSTIIFNTLNYYFIMAILTLDRLLVFYFNIKYQFYVSQKRVLRSIISFVTISFITTIACAILISLKKVTLREIDRGSCALFLMFDVAYMVLAAGTYCYIFLKYKRQLKLRKNNAVARNKDHFRLLIPSLIILTFILFTIIPDFLRTAVKFKIITSYEISVYVNLFCYKIGWFIDPLIYIFSLTFKRQKSKNDRETLLQEQ